MPAAGPVIAFGYRAGMSPVQYRYGSSRGQVADLWLPRQRAGALPVVVLVHGGYWRPWYTKALMAPMARALAEAGLAAWNIEYRRLGVGTTRRWPVTLQDVAAAIDYVGSLPEVDPGQVVVCGHSAGGQLSLWSGARHKLPPGAPGARPLVRPLAALALAGLVDLEGAAAMGLGQGAVRRFVGGTPGELPERYEVASPLRLLPLGTPQVLVHGLADDVVPCSMSESYQKAALATGDDVAYVPVAAASHRDLIRPAGLAWRVLMEQLGRFVPVASAASG